jgi:hypothetical protein
MKHKSNAGIDDEGFIRSQILRCKTDMPRTIDVKAPATFYTSFLEAHDLRVAFWVDWQHQRRNGICQV